MRKLQTCVILCLMGLLVGCGTISVSPKTSLIRTDLKMQSASGVGLAYAAPGCNLGQYDTVVVEDVSCERVLPQRGVVPSEVGLQYKGLLMDELRTAGCFKTVTADPNAGQAPAAKVAIIKSELSELDPGNRALRYMVGWGAGRVKVQLETEIRDAATQELCVKTSKRAVGIMGVFGGDSKGFILDAIREFARGNRVYLQSLKKGGTP